MSINYHSEESPSLATQLIQKLLYDRKSAAWTLSVSTRTIDYLIASGALETRRIGRKVLITAASLRKYAAANHYGPVNGTEEEAA
jgi:excisionase family DNA binding protein